MRLRRIVAELAQRAPLAQEIPVLVELRLERGQAMSLFGRELAAFEEAMLFSDQGLDVRKYGCVLVGLGHGIAPRARCQHSTSSHRLEDGAAAARRARWQRGTSASQGGGALRNAAIA